MEHTSSWRMDGAEEEEDDSPGNSPDITEVDLREQESIRKTEEE